MNLRELTDGQIRHLQGVCKNEFREINERVLKDMPQSVLWDKAFSRGVQATLTMFSAKLQANEKTDS